MIIRYLTIGIICSLTLLLSGCATPKPIEYKDYQNFKIQKIGASSSTVSMELVYYNPNQMGLQLKRTELDIYLDNTLLGHTSQEMQITIPRKSNFVIPIKVNVDMKNIWKNALNSLLSKEILVKVKGSVKVGKANVFMNFPINYEGKHSFSIL